MNTKIKNNQEGFIALVSAIVISLVLMAIVFSLSFRGFFGRFNLLDSEFKERSIAVAEACGDNALLRLAQDINYAGSESFDIGDDTCKVLPINNILSPRVIYATANVYSAVTNLKITVDEATLSVSSWQEIPKRP
ncbi:MAG: hypothetical protein Q8Q06_02405 [bacterium]|nr:hypothetical protein [bacterium]